MIGDTNSNAPILTDEEIAHFETLNVNLFLVAADCCDAICGKFARDIDRSNLGMSATRSQQVQHYMDLAKSLRARANSGDAATDAGSPTISTIDAYQDDSDARAPVFYRGMNSFAGGDDDVA